MSKKHKSIYYHWIYFNYCFCLGISKFITVSEKELKHFAISPRIKKCNSIIKKKRQNDDRTVDSIVSKNKGKQHRILSF